MTPHSLSSIAQTGANDNTSTLSLKALESLRNFFGSQNHHPSAEHWEALGDIAATMERMADSACEPQVFLSAVDPGVGKTQTVIHFARALVANPAYQATGMIICVGRIAEAESLAGGLEIPKESFAVLTSDEDANSLGNPVASAAQILITTQQRIERACENRTFASVESLYYCGKPRQIRVWDEAWLPGCALTLSSDAILQVILPIRAVCPDLAEGIKSFAWSIDTFEDRDIIDVPDFTTQYAVPLYNVLGTLSGKAEKLPADQHATIMAIIALSGRSARVMKDNQKGITVLTYKDTLPDDLAPLLVLDASGRVRETYKFIQEHRKTLTRLKEAIKDYSPLAIHAWQLSGSKSGFEKRGGRLIEGITATILTKPKERWLCVVHKPGYKVADLEKQIREGLPNETSALVDFITWGNHMATNAYADTPNVILAGTLFMQPTYYTALTHLAQDKDMVGGIASKEDVARTTRGEHANLILQALCRGSVRRSNGPQCFPMAAYIIASARSGIPNQLTTIFPGCSVKQWCPLKPVLVGRPLEAMNYITTALQKKPWVSYKEVAKAIGMQHRDYKAQVRKHRAWEDALLEAGFEECQGPRGAWGVCRVTVEAAQAA